MDPQRLAPFVAAIKESPEDLWAWLQLADAAKLIKEWNTATWAYCAALFLRHDDEVIFDKFTQARKKLAESKDKGVGFHFDIFKLPQNTAVIMLNGIVNMDLDSLKAKVKNIIKAGFRFIAFDFTGVSSISGLGPSLMRTLAEETEFAGGQMVLVGTCEDVDNMLKLKKINILQHKCLKEYFEILYNVRS